MGEPGRQGCRTSTCSRLKQCGFDSFGWRLTRHFWVSISFMFYKFGLRCFYHVPCAFRVGSVNSRLLGDGRNFGEENTAIFPFQIPVFPLSQCSSAPLLSLVPFFALAIILFAGRTYLWPFLNTRGLLTRKVAFSSLWCWVGLWVKGTLELGHSFIYRLAF